MKKTLLALIFILGCSALKQSKDEKPVLFIEKSACYGPCPVYKSEIFLSGKMTFQGTSNTKLKGHYCANISKKDLSRLLAAFNNDTYFSFKDAYLSRVKDLPTTITGINYKEKHKKIQDYDKAPTELKALEKMFETLVDTTSWKACN